MNKTELQTRFADLILGLTAANIVIHKDFIAELQDLIRTFSSDAKTIFAQLIQQIAFVSQLGKDCYQADHNEILSHCKDFPCYSLHINRQNLRLLGYYDDDTERFAFLCAFKEIAGKKVSGYSPHIKAATKRLSELKERGAFYD